MPDARMACMTSPEQGAQQECSSTLSWLLGSVSGRRSTVVFSPWLLAQWRWQRQADGPVR